VTPTLFTVVVSAKIEPSTPLVNEFQ
jgi:hypothetical protein